ncbi:MAG: transposase, partial [Pseudomonadota bacterium]|nr:transposase [Pseudomonadota bacterium]
MTYNPDIHRRRSIRLKGYDYSQAGAYFVSICTQNRECLFGEIVNRDMVLNDAGRMVESVWGELPIRFGHIELDQFIIMPNHIHAIFMLHRRGEPCVRPDSSTDPKPTDPKTTDPQTGDPKTGDPKTGEHK